MEWRVIPGFPDYEVSRVGQIRRCGQGNSNACIVGKVLRPTLVHGYLGFMLALRGRMRRMSAHRAVALAFIGAPPTPNHQVAHWDGNKRNNVPENLRWATPKENSADRIRHGTQSRHERAGPFSLTIEKVRAIREAYANGEGSQDEIATRFGASQTNVSRVVRRQIWKDVA